MATLGRLSTGASSQNIGDSFRVTEIGTMTEDGTLDSVHFSIAYNDGFNGGPRFHLYKGSIGALTLVADVGQIGSSTGIVSAAAASESLTNGDTLFASFKHDRTFGIGYNYDLGVSGDSYTFADVDADHDPTVAPPSSITASGTASTAQPAAAYITYTSTASGGTKQLVGGLGLFGREGLLG